ncbi:piercer of microtubule wall 1 protein [Athalia rosae]|uniref:piercer of microtubule wall 1 protein n=1 Tax=Athalia rosae TaxID=37344 RepID=UPI002033BA55|nr:piercer of microtubule wall 1 protein [Athalia rosae]
MPEIPTFCNEGRAQNVTEDSSKPLGTCTSEVYLTCNLPMRFMYPRVFQGYRQDDCSLPHPCYRSTSMDYGWHAPTIHSVPTSFFPRTNEFTNRLARAGMYRNCSLNTELDKSFF